MSWRPRTIRIALLAAAVVGGLLIVVLASRERSAGRTAEERPGNRHESQPGQRRVPRPEGGAASSHRPRTAGGGRGGRGRPRAGEKRTASREEERRRDRKMLARVVADLLAGRWETLEVARRSLAAAGSGAALDLLSNLDRRAPTRWRVAAALLVEDFLDGPRRSVAVVERSRHLLIAGLEEACSREDLVRLNPLVIRLIGHFPGSRAEEFLADQLSRARDASTVSLLVDSLGRVGGSRAAELLTQRFRDASDLETRRVALLALSRLNRRSPDPALESFVGHTGFAVLVQDAGAAATTPAQRGWVYATLGLALDMTPAELIARRVLPGAFDDRSKRAALDWLAWRARPHEARLLFEASASVQDAALARDIRAVAHRLARQER